MNIEIFLNLNVLKIILHLIILNYFEKYIFTIYELLTSAVRTPNKKKLNKVGVKCKGHVHLFIYGPVGGSYK